MNCKKCKKPLHTYKLLTDKGVESIDLCATCQANELDKFQQANQRILGAILERNNVPKRYWTANRYTAGMQNSDLRLIERFDKGIYFYGTMNLFAEKQLVAWLKWALMQGKTVQYIDWSDWLCELKANLNNYIAIRNKYTQADCLFISGFEVGGQYVSDYTYNFFNHVYKNNKTVYLSSENLVWQDRYACRLSELTFQYELVKND